MDIDISSFMGRSRSPDLQGQKFRSEEGGVNRSNGTESLAESVENSFSKGSKGTEPQVDMQTLGNNKIDYLVDHETNEVVIRIVDNESGEVIRQIPGEEFLRFANRISNFNQKYLDETI
tara:strand:+ start:85 stop:441 length:357 start_codon:yes stop_codon:yes gene_type:complete